MVNTVGAWNDSSALSALKALYSTVTLEPIPTRLLSDTSVRYQHNVPSGCGGFNESL